MYLKDGEQKGNIDVNTCVLNKPLDSSEILYWKLVAPPEKVDYKVDFKKKKKITDKPRNHLFIFIFFS